MSVKIVLVHVIVFSVAMALVVLAKIAGKTCKRIVDWQKPLTLGTGRS